MEAALLMFDVIGIGIVLMWAARGKGTSGLLAWRATPPDRPASREE